jgi:hypothetical protein
MSPIDVFIVAVYVAFSLMVIAGGDDQVVADAVDVSAAAELDESDEPQPASTGIAAMPTMAPVEPRTLLLGVPWLVLMVVRVLMAVWIRV